MKFIDLFAGLGGFHVALERLGHTCVFASEKKEKLALLYEKNFDISVNRDINKIYVPDIPSHDILCAGFPCQPFSKAGSQEGLNDLNNGNLFDRIVEILSYHKPKYFILENVRNLETHDGGNTYSYIVKKLESLLKYSISQCILSPHQFNIPQHRERMFIIGSLKENLENFKWPKESKQSVELSQYLDSNVDPVFILEKGKRHVIQLWQKFIKAIPKSDKLPSWPIWSMEFGATYPFENTTPYFSTSRKLGSCKGSYGVSLKGLNRNEKFQNLPSYARINQKEFPTWKKHFIRSNREFYIKYRKRIDPIVDRIKLLEIPSHQKFEWNIQGGDRDIYKHIIQFRGSGVRVKRANYFPSLVTVRTQTPIIGWQMRYITPTEGARIQCLENLLLPQNLGTAYNALGNAVNSEIVFQIAKKLFDFNSKRILSKKINDKKDPFVKSIEMY